MKNTLKFNRKYDKLYNQSSARLIQVETAIKDDLNNTFIRLDTSVNGLIHLEMIPGGTVLLLYFIGNDLIPFCTARKYSAAKLKKYRNRIGQEFEIIVETEMVQEKLKLETSHPVPFDGPDLPE